MAANVSTTFWVLKPMAGLAKHFVSPLQSSNSNGLSVFKEGPNEPQVLDPPPVSSRNYRKP